MSDISELEGRITAALDRIAWSVENAAAPASEAPTVSGDSDLIEELEIEKATNERLSAMREKHVAQIERLEIRVTRLSERLQQSETEEARLQSVIEELSANNAQLREANAAYQDAAEAADAGLAAQLEHLTKLRQGDLAELDDIMAELGPLMKEA